MSAATHVIFDLGNTLIEFVEPFSVALQEYAKIKGKQYVLDKNDINEIDSLPEFLKEFLISIDDDSHKYLDKYEEFIKFFRAKIVDQGYQLMPGADKLVKHLHQNNILMAIATNVTKKELEFGISTSVGLTLLKPLFAHFITGADDSEVKNNKPAPDIFFVCADRFKPPPKSMDNCVIFEDSIRGITGASATGMKTVLINKKTVHEIGAIANKVTVIVDSLENFRPESVGLPPYE